MAQIILNATAPMAQRVVTAFGARLGLGRDATVQEVKQYLIDHIKAVVDQAEREAISQTPVDLT